MCSDMCTEFRYEKKINPESVSDIIRNHLGDFCCCCCFFSYGNQQKKLTIGMYKSRIAAVFCRADMSSNRCGLRRATNIGVGWFYITEFLLLFKRSLFGPTYKMFCQIHKIEWLLSKLVVMQALLCSLSPSLHLHQPYPAELKHTF